MLDTMLLSLIFLVVSNQEYTNKDGTLRFLLLSVQSSSMLEVRKNQSLPKLLTEVFNLSFRNADSKIDGETSVPPRN